MQEDYAHWVAIYQDPETNTVSAVHQKDSGISYEELDRSDNLIQFQMVKPDGSIIFSVPFHKGQGGQLVWRRRRQRDPGDNEVWFYIVGKRGAFVACLLPDYSIILDNNFNEANAVLSEVTPVRGEEGYVENDK